MENEKEILLGMSVEELAELVLELQEECCSLQEDVDYYIQRIDMLQEEMCYMRIDED